MFAKKSFIAIMLVCITVCTGTMSLAANEPAKSRAQVITEKAHKINSAINTDEIVTRFLQRAGFDVGTDDPIIRASMAGLAMKDSNAVQRIFSAFIEGALDVAEMAARAIFD